jgi:hypothetical protein
MYVDDIAAAQFDIENIGGSASGSYYFSANLPTVGGYVYNSPAQASLAPGDHVVNTLRWSGSTTGTFTIAVASSQDSDTVNNYASATINVPIQQSYYGYQYPPQTPYVY